MAVYMIELLNYSLKQSIQKHRFIHAVKYGVVLEDTVYSAFALFGTVFTGRSKIDKRTGFIVPKNVC